MNEASAEAATDSMRLVRMITGSWVTQILRATAELSLVDHIVAGVATADEIAAREGTDPAATYRLLRAAASVGLFVDAGDRRFAVTPLGSLLRKDIPGSLRAMAIVQGAPFHWQLWGALPEAVRTGGTRMHAVLGLDEGQTSFDYYGEHPAEGAMFAASMANATNLIIEDIVDAVDLAGVAVVADLGGSTGALVHALMKVHPDLHGMVFDRPHVVPLATKAAANAGLADRFTAVAGDFFTEVPTADLYLLKMILHDWTDDACVTLLRNCRTAAKPGARLIVVESVVGPIGEQSFGTLQDMAMLAVTDGQERDFPEFDALYAAGGWRRTNTKPTRTPQFIQELEAI